MKVVLYHLTGNANVKAVAYGLAEADLLASFYVSIAVFPGSLIDKFASYVPFAETKRRGFDQVISPFTKMWPWLEMGRITASKLGLSSLTDRNNAPFHIDSVCKNFDKYVATKLKKVNRGKVKAVYSYEDIAAFAFSEAKRQGITCLYDLPIGYWRAAQRLLRVEMERWPDWILTIPGMTDSTSKLMRKDEELALADQIFVASSFTAQTLKEFPGSLAPVHIIPYGFPTVNKMTRNYITANNKRRLKLLFVGSLTQRKGIADLFAVVKEFKNYVELTLVGTKTNTCFALENALKEHSWIESLPHNEILQLMRESDVLVFPSLFEGFGLVITEAMSQGTPVITTERTAGPDLINHNQNGWLIEAGSTTALQGAIEKLILNKNLISENGREATETAKKRPWSVYGSDLAEEIKKIMSNN